MRRDPLFKLADARSPPGINNLLACGATFFRLEGSLPRSDIYRMARALEKQFIAGYNSAPTTAIFDLDYAEDANYDKQAPPFTTPL